MTQALEAKDGTVRWPFYPRGLSVEVVKRCTLKGGVRRERVKDEGGRRSYSKACTKALALAKQKGSHSKSKLWAKLLPAGIT